MKYIHIECGFPAVVDELPIMKPNRFGVMNRFWEREKAFSESAEFQYRVNEPPTFNSIQRLLAHLVFNPSEDLPGGWVEIGPFDKERVIEAIKQGLEVDDDIIQQWFGADDVIRLLEAGDSFGDLAIAVHAICGGHESDQTTLRYVEQVLGKAE